RPAPQRQFHGLLKAHSRRLTEYRRRSAGNSFAADLARHQGSRRRRRRGGAGGDRQRGRRCAGAVGNSHRGAADRTEPVVGGRRCRLEALREREEIKNLMLKKISGWNLSGGIYFRLLNFASI